MAGTIGSGRRAKYAVVGTAVNLATSIEALTVGGQVFAAASTIQRVSADLQLEPLQPLPMKGSPEPLQLFSVRAIGAPHQLVLPPPPAAPLPLAHPLPVEVSLMEGKSRLEPWLAARITHWGGGQALLSLPDSLAYAKVCGAAEGGVEIAFTFLPESLRESAPMALPMEPAPWVRPPDADRSPSTSP
jgi:adenylate cyclase